MSVATRNPFALLDGPYLFLYASFILPLTFFSHRDPIQSSPLPVDETPSPSAPQVQAPKAESNAVAQPTRGTQRGRGGARGGRYYQRGGARAPGSGDNADAPAADDAAGDANKKRFDGEGRGRGRGRGRGDRGRGGRGGARPFDRHSATGKTDSDKKVHQGWGGDEGGSELKAEDAGAADAVVDATAADAWGTAATEPAVDAWGTGETPAAEGETAAAAAEGDKPAAEGRRGRNRDERNRDEREPEEEDNTLTLEQYIKQQKEKDLDLVPKLETRKANEGDDSIWKDAVAITKKDEDEDAYFVGKAKTTTKTRAKKEDKVFLEIDARFERPARGGGRGRGGDRGDRGDRGGDRGDRGRGGRGRGGRGRPNGNSTPALNVDDQTAFPSLA
ncbi:hypothetical protein EUX98_g58 [Antrodiella citrinella]|uniref:Hyaluronan/mRNA-binding protein domain-containing protein n=1 Tax=Antrodiella citrinella TaxID=2447956 RepID=A0A4S4N7Y3_9APHY|nr:hypothetical protein EUX98_g58 [Antrodiella citrinella]